MARTSPLVTSMTIAVAPIEPQEAAVRGRAGLRGLADRSHGLRCLFAEQYGGIGLYNANGLYRNFGGKLRSLAAGKKVVFIAQRTKLRKVSACLPHEPDRGRRHRLPIQNVEDFTVRRAQGSGPFNKEKIYRLFFYF